MNSTPNPQSDNVSPDRPRRHRHRRRNRNRSNDRGIEARTGQNEGQNQSQNQYQNHNQNHNQGHSQRHNQGPNQRQNQRHPQGQNQNRNQHQHQNQSQNQGQSQNQPQNQGQNQGRPDSASNHRRRNRSHGRRHSNQNGAQYDAQSGSQHGSPHAGQYANQGQRNANRKASRPSHRLSDHFNKKEFMCQCGQCKNDIKLSLGLVGALELLRAKARARITIVQGYMCPEAAEKVRRIGRNYYTLGVAAQIKIEGMSTPELFKLAEDIEELKGIGLNLDNETVHIDTRKEDSRYLFIIKNGEHIELTPEIRNQYIDSVTAT